jgi:hypothetical protein
MLSPFGDCTNQREKNAKSVYLKRVIPTGILVNLDESIIESSPTRSKARDGQHGWGMGGLEMFLDKPETVKQVEEQVHTQRWAVGVISSWWRRASMHRQTIHEQAARAIQPWWRRVRSRQRTLHHLHNLVETHRKKKEAAVKIQNWWRFELVMMEQKRRTKAANVLTRSAKSWIWGRRYRDWLKAARRSAPEDPKKPKMPSTGSFLLNESDRLRKKMTMAREMNHTLATPLPPSQPSRLPRMVRLYF